MSWRSKDLEKYRVKPNKDVNLSKFDCSDSGSFKGNKEAAAEELEKLRQSLDDLQEILYAEHLHKVLIVLQGMDTAGKDGTIRFVFKGVNPQSVRVSSFKVPNQEEAAHDYLWRVHRNTPAQGEIVIFNRSHYEDVLVTRVHHLISKEEMQKRFQQINNFEQMLWEEGATVLKFFLHIDKDEQKKRLLERLQDPKKQWKFSYWDIKERKLWPEYMKAYEHMLNHTSKDYAPWYIVPANKKWYRNVVVARIIVETLRRLDMKIPKPKEDLSKIVIE